MNPPDLFGLMGRTIVIAGILLAALGFVMMLGPRLPFLGRLPGDIVWTRGNVRVYLPITTCILLSLIATIVMSVIDRLRR